MDRPGRIPAARPRCSRRPASSRASRTRRSSCPKCFARPLYPAVRRASSTACSASTSRRSRCAQTWCSSSICLRRVRHRATSRSGPRSRIAAAACDGALPADPLLRRAGLTEVWTTLLFTLSMWVAVSARSASSGLAGSPGSALLLALTTLSRPVFVLFPFALAAVGLVRVSAARRRASVRALVAVGGRCSLPSRSRCCRGSPTTTSRSAGSRCRPPAASAAACGKARGRRTWSGRVQNELTDLADRHRRSRRARSHASRRSRRASSCRPAPMLEYVHQWQDIRLIWTDADRSVRARHRARRGRRRIPARRHRQHPRAIRIGPPRDAARARPVHPVGRRNPDSATATSTTLPTPVIRVCWARAGADAAAGRSPACARCARAGRSPKACLLAAPILYVTAVHLPLLTEARQSLPAQPIVLVLAVARRRRR